MLISFGAMAKSALPKSVDSASGATPLADLSEGKLPSLIDLFLGNKSGAIGEVCVLALIIGLVYLLARKVITWHIPVSFVGTVFLVSFLMEGFDFMKALALILSGGLLIGAIFMATDYVTSPTTGKGKLIFGIGAGLITFMIRYFGVYPEGVSFSILIMNILSPYIEKLCTAKPLGAGGKKNV